MPCKDGLKHKNCPICGKEDAFSGAEVNYTGLELQRVALEKLTEESLLEVFMEMKVSGKTEGPNGLGLFFRKKTTVRVENAAITWRSFVSVLNVRKRRT